MTRQASFLVSITHPRGHSFQHGWLTCAALHAHHSPSPSQPYSALPPSSHNTCLAAGMLAASHISGISLFWRAEASKQDFQTTQCAGVHIGVNSHLTCAFRAQTGHLRSTCAGTNLSCISQALPVTGFPSHGYFRMHPPFSYSTTRLTGLLTLRAYGQTV